MDVRMGRFYFWQLRHVPDERSGDEEDWSPQSRLLFVYTLHVLCMFRSPLRLLSRQMRWTFCFTD